MKLRWPIFTVLVLPFSAGLRAQITPPAAPEIIRVSVDTLTQLADIRWDPSPSTDVEKYVVYYYMPGIDGAQAVDTVSGDYRAYTYPRNPVDPGLAPQTLTVAAIDSSGNVGLLPGLPHETLFLTAAYDSCEKSMNLAWNSYRGWDQVVRYEVYLSVDGNAFALLEDGETQDTAKIHFGIEDNHRYCYLIKAVSPTTYSFSNIACKNVTHPLFPGWIDAESASAIGEDQVELRFALDPAGEVTSFRLYKAAGPGKPFIPDAIIRNAKDSIIYTDQVISTKLPWLYKLYALDVCDNINPETGSNVCGNIVLEARSVSLESFLSWSPYTEFEAGVKGYGIYRNINKAGFELIGGTGPSDTSFVDDLSWLTYEAIQDEICYYILAGENDSYTRGNQGSSRSNTACVSVEPEIRMANAIIPNAINEENTRIKPVLSFVPKYYIFQVFDRWGSMIFETEDPGIYWYGRVRGKKNVPEGVYVYYIRLITSNGIEREKRGQITVFYK